ncbi:MAG: UDP-glucose 4-epimerase [uncultured Aureispira sp.]|uniref:UDP-glucose 4-epimerase n=1 Tax=uncultured Aureispira sp. TaxID=1331704 RepID=A0A6S6UAI7_9BACT|nr:MAG: UDP-glucose 4-epimerase [uncultured Aureispira sp.]
MIQRLLITNEAASTIDTLTAEHGELIFHQSGGCCDGSSPICLPKEDFLINEMDVWLGKIHGCNFYMSKDQFDYWESTQLTLDATKGRGASFSLEISLGVYFVIKSRLFSPEEMEQLSPIRFGA